MKRIIPILLILVLLAGCAGARDTMDRASRLLKEPVISEIRIIPVIGARTMAEK